MKRILLNQHGRLRNGWWVLVFFALFLLSRVAYTPLSQALQAVGVGKDALGPLYQAQPQWLTGGEFGPESSVCAVAVDLVAIALLWRWKGTRAAGALPRQLPPLAETAMQRT